MKTNIIDSEPDVEVFFEFTDVRKVPIYDGYRPTHLIKDNYLTSGIHHYYNATTVLPNETATGTITFITPEAYPSCLWVGKKINIQEGERIIGFATITKIFNPILENSNL
jgi:elongation factor Tu